MSDARWGDPRVYSERDRGDERPRVYDQRDRDDRDPRGGLMHDLDLPRGEDRELVVDRDRVCELNGEDSRTLAAVGAFRVVPEHDLDIDHDTLDHLREQGFVEAVDLGHDERGLVLTKDGRDLLDSHTLERATSRRRRSTSASVVPARSTTIRISTQRTARRKPVSEIARRPRTVPGRESRGASQRLTATAYANAT
jgi:hypothetical protein